MIQIRNLALGLDSRLAKSLERFRVGTDAWGLTLPQPRQLSKRAFEINRMFDEGKPPEPPSQARINALGRLRQGKVQISRKDWQLIVWGLCDDCGRAGLPIDDAALFAKVMQFVDTQSDVGIGRKVWFGLFHSYFAYPAAIPEESPGWQTLRSKLALTLPALLQRQARQKSWAQALARHNELLTDRAGEKLAQALARNDDSVAKDIATYFPVPENSWLWRDMIERRLAMLLDTSDETFRQAIPSLLELGVQHASHSDEILAAVLARYSNSAFRSETHGQLKQRALDLWQNPQVKTANRWSLVADDVRRMVLQWFAKADLEHFFSLLQGDGSVDQARLNYWLRFVDQISYTRVVMGLDAFSNQNADFINFRDKNKGRFSRLTANNTDNNAFIMQIGEYYFVEFSGTGNACYVYPEASLPFNPEHANFTLLNLKNKDKALDRLIHNGAWEYKADMSLAKLGLRAGEAVHRARSVARASIPSPPTSASRPHKIASSTWPAPSPAPVANPTPAVSQEPADKARDRRITQSIYEATIFAIRMHMKRDDLRPQGGAFWILDDGKDQEVRKHLIQLGFGYINGRGFWIK